MDPEHLNDTGLAYEIQQMQTYRDGMAHQVWEFAGKRARIEADLKDRQAVLADYEDRLRALEAERDRRR